MPQAHRPGAAPEAAPAPRAQLVEMYAPAQMNIEAPGPGEEGNLVIHAFIGQLGPALFMFRKSAEISPDVAIQLGEYLASEGRRVKNASRLHVAKASDIPRAA